MALADRSSDTLAGGIDPADQRARDRLSVALRDIAPLRMLAQSLGVETAGATPQAAASRSAAFVAEAETEIPLSEFFTLFRQLMAAAPDETLSMSRRPLAPGTTDFVVETVRGAQTLEDAMRRVARAFNHVHGGFYNRVELRRDRLAYLIDDREFPYASPVASEATEGFMHGMLIFLHALLSLAVGAPLCGSVACIRTRRTQRLAPDGLLSFWTAQVKLAAPYYAIEYRVEAADAPVRFAGDAVPTANAVFDMIGAMIADRSAAPGPKTFRARIEACLDQGVTGQSAVARRLGVSPATMRRRLTAEGTTFRELRAVSIAWTARRMLEQGRPVADVAESLGFADIRSFSRAFKQRFGETPTAFAARRKVAVGAG